MYCLQFDGRHNILLKTAACYPKNSQQVFRRGVLFIMSFKRIGRHAEVSSRGIRGEGSAQGREPDKYFENRLYKAHVVRPTRGGRPTSRGRPAGQMFYIIYTLIIITFHSSKSEDSLSPAFA